MIFQDINEAYVFFLEQLKTARESKPRGMKIKECLGVSFTLANPRNRITRNHLRKMSLSFAYGEFLWYLRGSDRLDVIQYYSKMYSNFSDDMSTVNGAYGTRIFGGKLSQWDQVKEILVKDPESRQAVISIHQPRDLFIDSSDIPCTCTLQYFIRNGKLNAITYMRSNDIYLGMPYDVFSFTMLQEMLATELNVELGTYTHMVGSLHIYEKNFSIFDYLKEENEVEFFEMQKMNKEAISTEQISLILEIESELRKNEKLSSLNLLHPYWLEIVSVLQIKNEKEYKRTISE